MTQPHVHISEVGGRFFVSLRADGHGLQSYPMKDPPTFTINVRGFTAEGPLACPFQHRLDGVSPCNGAKCDRPYIDLSEGAFLP